MGQQGAQMFVIISYTLATLLLLVSGLYYIIWQRMLTAKLNQLQAPQANHKETKNT